MSSSPVRPIPAGHRRSFWSPGWSSSAEACCRTAPLSRASSEFPVSLVCVAPRAASTAARRSPSTETPVVSTLREIAAYLRERYDSRRFVPLALVLGVVGTIAAGSRLDSPPALIQSVVVSYLLVLAFRVWDDLEDRERDRRLHPVRVLTRSGSMVPWLCLIACSLSLSATLMALGPRPVERFGLVAAGGVVLFAWYRLRRLIDASPLVGMSVIFAKYPLIAYVAAPPSQPVSPLTTALSLLGLYAALCTYELVDDTALRGSI